MALIKCPECGKEVSDKASACIHCGFPLCEVIDKSSNIKSFGALEKAATIYITHANHNIIKVPNLKELGSLENGTCFLQTK